MPKAKKASFFLCNNIISTDLKSNGYLEMLPGNLERHEKLITSVNDHLYTVTKDLKTMFI